jgi:hypothetical protein
VGGIAGRRPAFFSMPVRAPLESDLSETVLPVATEPAASEPVETNVVEQVAAEVSADAAPQDEKPAEQEDKPAKTQEQREIERMRRKIDRLVRQREELRALSQQRPLAQSSNEEDNRPDASNSDTLTLSRAEAQRLIELRARELAPVVGQQQAAIEHRQKVVSRLATDWGQERFDALASDLDDAFGGLRDASNAPRPVVDALFEADDPKQLIEYLADPDNSDEAAALARLPAVSAGRAIARLEAKLAERKSKVKSEPSKIPAPIELPRGQGSVTKDPSQMTDAEFARWRRAQIKSRM